MTILARVTTEPIDLAPLLNFIRDDAHGAIDVFLGVVRNQHHGKSVTGITYDAHAALAEKTFYEICLEAQGLWPKTRYAVVHFKGNLHVGDTSLVIAVSSPHRAESFESCRYVIEEIKKRAPIWKKEHYEDGQSEWLPGHSLQDEALTAPLLTDAALSDRHV